MTGSLGDRLTVGQVPLEHFVQVRILVAQPKADAMRRSGFRVLWRQQHAAELNGFSVSQQRRDEVRSLKEQSLGFLDFCRIRNKDLQGFAR